MLEWVFLPVQQAADPLYRLVSDACRRQAEHSNALLTGNPGVSDMLPTQGLSFLTCKIGKIQLAIQFDRISP